MFRHEIPRDGSGAGDNDYLSPNFFVERQEGRTTAMAMVHLVRTTPVLVKGSRWSDIGIPRCAEMLDADPASHEEARHARIIAVHAKLNSRRRSRLDRSLQRSHTSLVDNGECANIETNFLQLWPLAKNATDGNA